MSKIKFVLVVPCYNETSRLEKDDYLSFLAENANATIHFVNDASTDGTLNLLESWRLENPEQIAITDLAKNSGKAEAVRTGLLEVYNSTKYSHYQFAGFWDADLATPLNDVTLMANHLSLHPLRIGVFGSRILKLGNPILRKKSRHYMGRVFATCVSIITNVAVYDSQCGAKLFRRDVVDTLFGKEFKSRWFFDVEIIMRAKSIGKPEQIIFELPLSSWSDIEGSKLKLKDFLKVPFELAKIWLSYRK